MNKLLLILLLSLSSKTFAQSYVGPQASAMGGAGRAAIVPGESAFLNPASVSFFTQYFGTGFYSSGSHPGDGDEQQLGALLSDGTADRLFQGSLAYIRSTGSPVGSTDFNKQDIRATGSNFVWKNLSFGISAHRVVYKQPGIKTSTQWNGGLGLLYRWSEKLSLGLVADDLLKPSDAVPLEARLMKSYGAGLSYTFDELLALRFDASRTPENNLNHNTTLMTGFESEVAQYFAFRGGFRWDENFGPERRYFTTGLGFKGPKLRADYSFEKDTTVAGGIRHSFDLWMSF